MKEHVGEDLLNMYLDGELSTAQHAGVEAHLHGCEACRSELLALQKLFESLEELRNAPVPDLWPKVRALLGEKRSGRRRLWLVLALQCSGALALLIWGRDQLTALGARIAQTFASPALVDVHLDFASWWVDFWETIDAWAAISGENMRAWFGELLLLDGRGISVQHGLLLAIVLVTAWLVGNLLLLRRPYRQGRLLFHHKEASR